MKYYVRGIICAGAGLVLARLAPFIAGTPGLEPTWAVVILAALLVAWALFSLAGFLKRGQ